MLSEMKFFSLFCIACSLAAITVAQNSNSNQDGNDMADISSSSTFAEISSILHESGYSGSHCYMIDGHGPAYNDSCRFCSYNNTCVCLVNGTRQFSVLYNANGQRHVWSFNCTDSMTSGDVNQTNIYRCTNEYSKNATCCTMCANQTQEGVCERNDMTTTTVCEDIDECESNQTNCHSNAICQNTYGSYRCVCTDGFTGNGTSCVDIDECESNQTNCHSNAICQNTHGSYQCLCTDGFTGNGTSCVDMDECMSEPCHRNAICSNTIGSYNCSCNEGYKWDGYKCLVLCGRRDDSGSNLPSCSKVLAKFKEEANSTETVAEASRQIADLTSQSGNFTADEVENVARFIQNTGDLLREGKIKVSGNTAWLVASIIDRISDGYFINENNHVQRNVTGERQFRRQIVEAVSTIALRVDLDSAQPTFNLSFSSFKLQAELHIGTDYPTFTSSYPNATTVVEIPSEATEQAWNDATARKRRDLDGGVRSNRRSAFIFYKDGTLFYSNKNVSSVVSAAIGLNGSVSELLNPVKISHRNQLEKYGKSPPNKDTLLALKTTLECVYWDFDLEDWSTDGCCFNHTADPPECLCYHLTNFALIVKSENVPADVVLNVVSEVGCVLSILGLFITIAVHMAKKELRQRRPAKILMQICCNLCISYVIFVAGVSRTGDRSACIAVAALLHYFMLVTWCWMMVYSYDIYVSLVKVFRRNESYFMRRFGTLSYTTPAIVVGITVGVAEGYYGQLQTNLLCGNAVDPLATSYYIADNVCWLKGYALYLGFLLPVGAMLLYNLVVFVVIFVELFGKSQVKSSATKQTHKQRLMIAMTMAFIMGLTWVFGFLLLISENPIYVTVLSWIFAVSNTLQGFGIFLLLAVRRSETRKVWWNPIRNRVSKSPSILMSKMNSSHGKYTVQTAVEMEDRSTTNMTSVTEQPKKEYFVEEEEATDETRQANDSSGQHTVEESSVVRQDAQDGGGGVIVEESSDNKKVA